MSDNKDPRDNIIGMTMEELNEAVRNAVTKAKEEIGEEEFNRRQAQLLNVDKDARRKAFYENLEKRIAEQKEQEKQ